MKRGIEIHQHSLGGWQRVESHSPSNPELIFIISREPIEQTLRFRTNPKAGITVVFDSRIISFQTSQGSYCKEETTVTGILNKGDVFYAALEHIYDDKATKRYPTVYRITQT